MLLLLVLGMLEVLVVLEDLVEFVAELSLAHSKGWVSTSALDYYQLWRGTLEVWVLFASMERAILTRFGLLDPFFHEENGFSQFTTQPTLIMVFESIFWRPPSARPTLTPKCHSSCSQVPLYCGQCPGPDPGFARNLCRYSGTLPQMCRWQR